MHYRRLGSSNLRVSVLCLGTMMFGDQTDAKEAAAIVADARDHGVNFIDTADVYTKGASEAMLGDLLQGQREHWVLATKLGNAMGKGPNQVGYSRSWMLRELDASLARLRTDHVDVLYLHRDFEGMDLAEPVRALGDLVRAGKIRAWALSNFRGWRIAEAVRLADALGVPRPVACQPYYNLLNRQPEVEILPACAHYGIGVVPYSPIARGVLTGKYAPGQAPAQGTRAGRGDKRIAETEFRDESLRIAQQLLPHAQAKGLTLAQFATAWVLHHHAVSAVIAGPRTLEQWTSYAPAIDAAITADDERLVDSLVPAGHPSTPGYNDPQYPLHPRRPA
jgi:aryl-alcohol dehydrogenase-like predicted oxidoreductase